MRLAALDAHSISPHPTPNPPLPILPVQQNAGIADIDGMIGANSVAVSPDGKFVYVSSGGYYRGAFPALLMTCMFICLWAIDRKARVKRANGLLR